MLKAAIVGVTLAAVVGLGTVTPAHAAAAPAANNLITDLWDQAVYVTSELLAGTYGATVGDPAATFNENSARGRRGAQGANSHNGASGSIKKIPTGTGTKLVNGVAAGADAIGNYNLGTAAGKWGLSWFGIDADQTVCSGTGDDPMGQLWRTLSGADCSAFGTAPAFVPNVDVTPLEEGWRNQMNLGSEPTQVKIGGSPTGRMGSFNVYWMTVQTAEPWWWPALKVVCKPDQAGQAAKVVSLTAPRWGASLTELRFDCGVGYQIEGFGVVGTSTGYATTAAQNTIAKDPSRSAYFTQLNLNYRPAQGGDPERTLECTTTYTDGSVTTGLSAPYKESSKKFATPVCPPPVLPVGAPPKVVDKVNVKDSTGKVVYNNTTTTVYKTEAAANPACMDGSCVLNLKVKATGKSCFDLGDACKNWLDTRADYQCSYGTANRAIESCFIYGNTFDRAKVAAGNGYSDPATGNDTQSNTSPGVDQVKMNRDVRPNAQDRDCFGAGWASVANPLDWVMVPVNCSLEWAWVPRDVVIKEAAYEMTDAWDDTPPGKISAFVGALGAGLPVVDGCSGPHVQFAIDLRGFAPWAYLSVDAYPLSACSPPWDFVAATARIIGGLFMYYAAFRATTRYLGGIVGFTEFGKGA